MSQKIYCIAMFEPKEDRFDELFATLKALEANSHKEAGCIQYTVTKHIKNDFAPGTSFPIVFNEIWKDKAAFEEHCQRQEITDFFNAQCMSENGAVKHYNVCVYSDE